VEERKSGGAEEPRVKGAAERKSGGAEERSGPGETGRGREPPEFRPIPGHADDPDLDRRIAAGLDGLGVTAPQVRQIARLVIREQKVRVIADLLGLKYGTVRTHLNRLHKDLGVHTNIGLAAKVLRGE
jgi:DNA-binding CsgD family transcriptional regulator